MADDKQKIDLASQINKLRLDEANLIDDITSAINKQAQAINEVLKSTDQTVEFYKLEKRLINDIQKAQKQGNKKLEEELDIRLNSLKKAKDLEKVIKKTRDSLTGVNDKAKDLANNLQSGLEKLPGGKALTRMLGINEMADNFEASLEEAGKAYLDVIKDGGSAAEASAAGMKAFGASFKALLGPVGLIVAAVGGLALLFNKLNKEAKDLSKATGLTVSQSKLLATEARAITSDLGAQLSTSEDILAVQKATLPVFSNINALSTQQAATISEIGLAFGYGAEQAAKVNNAFMLMGVSAEEAATQQRNLSAEALKAGVNVGTVVADIAESSKDVVKFFGGNVKELKKAAIEAAKLGMSIKEMGKVSDSLLQFEESISAQFELQALTGSQINLDLARQKALQGDIAGATKEVLSQVGGIAEFNEMDVIQRQALAKATGLSVDELQKSLTIQEKLGDLSDKETAAMANLGLSASEMASMSAEELQNRLAQQQATDQTAQSFKAMGDILMNALEPAAEAIGAIFSALAPVLKIAFAPIEYAAKALGVIVEYAKEYYGITIAIGSLLAAHLINKKMQAAIDATRGVNSAKELAMNYIKTSQLGVMLGLSEAQVVAENAKNTSMLRGIAIGAKDLVISAAKGVAKLAGAVAGIFSSFAQIPFGIGIPFGIAAVGALMAMFAKAKSQKVGDMSIDPNGGPIVTTPNLGGIFQGKKQDGLSMGPGMGSNPDTGGGGGGDSVGIDYQRMAQAIVTAMAGLKLQPAPIQIGSQVINAISDEMEVIKSYK